MLLKTIIKGFCDYRLFLKTFDLHYCTKCLCNKLFFSNVVKHFELLEDIVSDRDAH